MVFCLLHAKSQLSVEFWEEVQALFFNFLLKSIFVIKSLLYETIYSHFIRGEGEIIYKKTVFFHIWNMKSDFSNGGQQTYMHFCSRFANIHG